MHGKAYLEAKRELAAQKELDPKQKKSKTLKAKAALQDLREVTRYAVMNRRTGWVATSEWLNHHVKMEEGKPCPKGKGKLWIVSVRIRVVGLCIDIAMSPADGKALRPIRCFSIQDGGTNAKLSSIVSGYSHLLTDDDLEKETHPLSVLCSMLACTLRILHTNQSHRTIT